MKTNIKNENKSINDSISIEDSINEISQIDKQEYNPINWKNNEIRICKLIKFNEKNFFIDGQSSKLKSSADLIDLKSNEKIRIGLRYNNNLTQMQQGKIKENSIFALRCLYHKLINSKSYPVFCFYIFDKESKKWIKTKQHQSNDLKHQFINPFDV